MPPGGAVFGFQPYKSTEKQLCAFSAVKTFVASVSKQHCIQHKVAPRIRKAGQRGSNKPQCVCQRWWNQLQAFCSGSAHTGEGCLTRKPRDELPQTVAVTHVSDTARGGDTLTVSWTILRSALDLRGLCQQASHTATGLLSPSTDVVLVWTGGAGTGYVPVVCSSKTNSSDRRPVSSCTVHTTDSQWLTVTPSLTTSFCPAAPSSGLCVLLVPQTAPVSQPGFQSEPKPAPRPLPTC